ncbi:MAG: hypothetical protein WC314_07115 [Vulcanimicrobiota bacterium]
MGSFAPGSSGHPTRPRTQVSELFAVVTRETADGTPGLVCTNVDAMSDQGLGALEWVTEQDGAFPLTVRLLPQKAISSPLQVPPTTNVTLKPAPKPGPIFEARRAAICIYLLTS